MIPTDNEAVALAGVIVVGPPVLLGPPGSVDEAFDEVPQAQALVRDRGRIVDEVRADRVTARQRLDLAVKRIDQPDIPPGAPVRDTKA